MIVAETDAGRHVVVLTPDDLGACEVTTGVAHRAYGHPDTWAVHRSAKMAA